MNTQTKRSKHAKALKRIFALIAKESHDVLQHAGGSSTRVCASVFFYKDGNPEFDISICTVPSNGSGKNYTGTDLDILTKAAECYLSAEVSTGEKRETIEL
jgi:hypothetical protein